MKSHEETLHGFIDHIANSKSGATLQEAIVKLDELVRCESEARESLFSRKDSLRLLTKSYTARRSKSLATSTRKRFEAPDLLLLEMLSNWESDFGAAYPIFSAWLAHERKRGVEIPLKAEENLKREESSKLISSVRVAELDQTKRETSNVFRELEELLQSFTPGLEEIFADIEETDPGSQLKYEPREVKGENDELYNYARERFDYLTKKLIPRLETLVKDLDSQHPSGKEGAQLLSSIQNSSTYLNFLMLLSKFKRVNGDGNKKKKKLTGTDPEYEEWF
jgi:hypothetical protein